MTDTFTPPEEPTTDEPVESLESELPEAGFGDFGAPPAPAPQQMLPPDPAEIMAQLAASRPVREPDPVSPKDRLFLGAKIRAADVVPPETDPAPQPEDLARQVASRPEAFVNVGARLAQALEQSLDPSETARGWQRTVAAQRQGFADVPNLDRLLSGEVLPEDEWDELRVAVDKTAESFRDIPDNWMVGKGKVVDLDGATAQIEYPEDMALDDLPDSLTGDPSPSLPEGTLRKQVDSFTVFAGTEGVTYAADATPENDYRIRAEFPGPVGPDGKPRWVPVQPLPLTDHAAIERGIISNPTGVVETVMDPDGYFGTRGGEWILFDAPEKPGVRWDPPAWTGADITEVRGGISRQRPEVEYRPLSADDLVDAATVYDRLEDTSWAVVQGSAPEGGIELRVDDGDPPSWIVFGKIPADLADDFDRVFTADGIVGEELSDDDSLPGWGIPTVSGAVVPLQATDGISAGTVERVAGRARRMAYRVDPSHSGRIGQLADALEASGASNTVIYSRQAKLDGWEQARERVFHDGVSMKVVRAADQSIGDPHAVPVHVRSAAGLPTDPFTVAGDFIDAPPIEPEGDTYRVPGGDDLGPAAFQAAVLAQRYGHEAVQIDGPEGPVKLFQP